MTSDLHFGRNHENNSLTHAVPKTAGTILNELNNR